MTESTKETQQTQSATTQPWAPAIPLVSSLIGKYGNLSTDVTPGQTSALTNLNNSLTGVPNFGNAGSTAISNLFNQAGSGGQVGMLNTAYDTLRSNLGGTASGANLNPYDTPGFGDAIRTAIDDATKATKGVYAGSGRDPSGAGSFAGSLSRGITQGISPTIANQYNQNYSNMVNANNQLFQGAGSTASAINNLRAGDTATTLAALQGAGSIPGLYSSPALAQFGAANLGYSLPYQNLAQLLQPSISLAGLGTQSQGQGSSTSTSTPSLLSSIGQGIGAGGSLLQMGPSIAALFSDERLKEDAAPVGKLNDGQTVWSYRYKGDPTPRIGLMASEVEKKHPGAVFKHPSGFKMVDYGRATRHARVGALAA